MAGDRRQEISSDKRKGPIVQDPGGRRARTAGDRGGVRRAGSRRQARIAVFVILFVGAVIVGGYYLLVPHDRAPTISGYSTAPVTIRTLQDTVGKLEPPQVAGSFGVRAFGPVHDGLLVCP